MARHPRYVPHGGAIVEVSNRTLQGRFLLRPSPHANEVILGVLGRAQRMFDLLIFAFVFMSDHYHLLVLSHHAHQLARFMEYVDGNLAREMGRISKWRGKFWNRRYHSAIVKSGEASELDRLRYILSNGCKEGLVASPLAWPGASSTPALVDGTMTLTGRWYDRTREYRARLSGLQETYSVEETVRLSPLPSLAHLTNDELREHIMGMLQQIETETSHWHRANGTKPLGPKRVLRQHPHRVPVHIKHSPARRFLAAFRESVAELRSAYALFLARYRDASRRFRDGDRFVEFPPGCFPPSLPFVRAGP
jgi:REP-associated tyrosine transposase